MFKLVIQDDEGKTTVVPLIRDEITIGRKEGNTIRLTERNVSRRHARILRNAGEVHIEDLGSYNGIRVNNARIAERVSLRVSDQVQIGDYKLYLKAEAVEQVDDARTMPIERIDPLAGTDGLATVKPNGTAAASASALPTTPIPVQSAAAVPSPGVLPANAQLVGNPARTLVAIADTDPQGRPVASAATVAALTAPAQYGKLVVLSSNFAGKEFDLTRPQMIIGRTDENDIVINHRSISRNHAKLVREVETGRYTVSDLQSSNGVRVNGQDYGKVELRRGDVVDLGHVRLRFVEPGEDFVFARDAVITDVPDSGSKKGMLVAVVLAILVLGGVGAFLLMKNKESNNVVNGNKDGSGSGTLVAQRNPGSDPPAVLDADSAIAEVVVDAAAAVGSNVPTGDDAEGIAIKCQDYIVHENFDKADECVASYAKAGGTSEDLKGALARAKTGKQMSTKLAADLKAGKYKNAKDDLAKIDPQSDYFGKARDELAKAESEFVSAGVTRAQRSLSDKSCKGYVATLAKIDSEYDRGIGDRVRSQVSCSPQQATVAVRDPGTTTTVKDPNNGKPPNPDKDPTLVKDPTPCDFDALNEKGQVFYRKNQWGAALSAYEDAYRCKGDPQTAALAALAACHTGRAAEAKRYYVKAASGMRAGIQQTCAQAQPPISLTN